MQRWGIAVALVSLGCSSRTAEESAPLRGHEPHEDALTVALRSPVTMVRDVERTTDFDVSLPTHAGAPLVVSTKSVQLTMRAIDDAPVERVTGGRRVTFAGARRATDVVYLAGATATEELRILRDATAETSARYEICAPGLTPRIREGRIELTRGAYSVLGTAPLMAADAIGQKRAPSLSIEPRGECAIVTVSIDTKGLAFPVVVDPAWTAGPSLSTPRTLHGAATLTNGKVLVAGGTTTGGVGLSSAELYDPATNTWSAAGTLPFAPAPFVGPGGTPFQLRMAALPGARAIFTSNAPQSSVYDAATNAWSASIATSARRTSASLTALPSGKVLLAGGYSIPAADRVDSSTAEIFDPVTNVWTTTGSMKQARSRHAAAAFGSGKVLVVSGDTGTGTGIFGATLLSSAELYDESTGAWTDAASITGIRTSPGLSTLPSGKLLMFGGQIPKSTAGAGSFEKNDAQIYDPIANSWSATGSLIVGRRAPTYASTNGKVLTGNVGGGFFSTSTELFDPATGTWSYAGEQLMGLQGYSASTFGGGKILFAGGFDSLANIYSITQIWGLLSLGSACAAPYDCASGACTDGVCCDSASCAIGSSCATAKKGSCAKVAAQPCTTAAECGSNFCVDGVCCNRACGATCEACDVATSLGTCTTIAGVPHGSRTACAGSGDPCTATACDGTDAAACHLPKAGVVSCGAPSCDKGIEKHASTCDGAGKCQDAPKSCGTFACGATACKTSCATSADCAPGRYCASGACVPVVGIAAACTDSSFCSAGLSCVDGVCCGSPSCGAGESCALPGKEGSCTKKAGTKCAIALECGSGLCVDGVCCDRACDGRCEACDVSGHEGTCTKVTGAPHGSRMACEKSGDACAATACDGMDATSCSGKVGSETACREASCAAGVRTAPAVCDGKGACPAPITASCDGFACDAAGKACRTSCSSDVDCMGTHRCEGGVCKPRTDVCTEDGSAVRSLDGSTHACAPYVCRAGACLTACGATSDCANGSVCFLTSQTCVDQSAPSEESSGGCSMGARRSNTSAWLVALLLGMVVARRRALLGAAAFLASCSPSRGEDSGRRVDAAIEHARKFALVGDLSKAHGSVSTVLPQSLDAPLEIEAQGVHLHVRPIGASSVRAVARHNAKVYLGSEFDTVYVAEPDRVEDLRILRSESGAKQVYAVDAEGATVRVREGRIEAVDANGRVAIGTSPVFAVDAHGRRRDARVTMIEKGRVEVALDTTDLAYPIVVDPAWSTGPSMKTARSSPGVAPLPSGKVIAIGGEDATNYYSTVEVYDEPTNTWSLVASMSKPRSGAAAIPLSGKIIAVGGWDASGPMSTAEIYDPATNSWSAFAAIPAARGYANIIDTPAGVMLWGGFDNNPTAPTSTLLYDATGGAWTTGGARPKATSSQAQVKLADGRVLTAGGVPVLDAESTAELFDPTTKTWSVIASMASMRADPAALLMADGKVLVFGGYTGGGTTAKSLSTSEIYDPATNKWTAGPFMTAKRYGMGVAKLASGKTLIAGGGLDTTTGLTSAEMFDPVKKTFAAAGSLPGRALYPILMPLPSGGAFTVSGAPELLAAPLGVSYLFAQRPLGESCSTSIECASSTCTDFACCTVASCTAGTTCATADKSGTCKKLDSLACTADSECASGHCVDGVCCNTSCTETCGACDVPGKVGKCSAVRGSPHGTRPACSGTAAGTTCGIACDGSSLTSCAYAASGSPCGTDSCSAGVETHVSTCDGSGACKDTSKSCGAYGCDTTACKTTCATTSDCATGNVCKTGTCVPLAGAGEPCTDGSQCGPMLFCTEGVCCTSPSCAAGSSCAIAGKKGACKKLQGVACSTADDCGSGHCVDGGCCSSACDASCEACDLAGKLGECTPVVGAPHGSRSCPGGEDKCAVGTCDGVATTTCNRKAGSDVVCRDASCKDGQLTAPARCDGSGVCPALVTTSCDGFACDPSGIACRTACAVPQDCVSGYRCESGKCARLVGTCSDDGRDLVGSDGTSATCVPFRCRDGACTTHCDTSDDCAGGVCDSASHICVQAASDTGADGGCAHARGTGSWLLVLVIAGAMRRGRRRSTNATIES